VGLGLTKRKIIEHLRGNRSTVAELAEILGLSKVAIYRHLVDLEQEGLVHAVSRRRGGRGRPVRVFEAIDETTAYARMCREMIQQIEELYGPGAGVRVLRARYRKELDAWKASLQSLDLTERAVRLADWLSEQGYRAQARIEGNTIVLEQRHCPKLALAKDYRTLCQVEMEFFGELMGVPLRRESSLSNGDACCRYRADFDNAAI